jgi:hypothetical protein
MNVHCTVSNYETDPNFYVAMCECMFGPSIISITCNITTCLFQTVIFYFHWCIFKYPFFSWFFIYYYSTTFDLLHIKRYNVAFFFLSRSWLFKNIQSSSWKRLNPKFEQRCLVPIFWKINFFIFDLWRMFVLLLEKR